jgi:hypothetical protein
MTKESASIFRSAFAVALLVLASSISHTAYAQAASATSQNGIVVVTDIEKWKHPTKTVFARHSVKLLKVEIDKSKRAVFYVAMPFDPQTSMNSATLNKLLTELLRSNGWWSYALYDEQDRIRIDVAWNKKKKNLAVDIAPLEEATPK